MAMFLNLIEQLAFFRTIVIFVIVKVAEEDNYIESATTCNKNFILLYVPAYELFFIFPNSITPPSRVATQTEY